MPSELELSMMARITALEKVVAALEKKLAGLLKPAEAQRVQKPVVSAAKLKEVAKDARKK